MKIPWIFVLFIHDNANPKLYVFDQDFHCEILVESQLGKNEDGNIPMSDLFPAAKDKNDSISVLDDDVSIGNWNNANVIVSSPPNTVVNNTVKPNNDIFRKKIYKNVSVFLTE